MHKKSTSRTTSCTGKGWNVAAAAKAWADKPGGEQAHLKLPIRFMHSWLPLSMMTSPPCSLACLASSCRSKSVPAGQATEHGLSILLKLAEDTHIELTDLLVTTVQNIAKLHDDCAATTPDWSLVHLRQDARKLQAGHRLAKIPMDISDCTTSAVRAGRCGA